MNALKTTIAVCCLVAGVGCDREEQRAKSAAAHASAEKAIRDSKEAREALERAVADAGGR
jgi:hypothetical protein